MKKLMKYAAILAVTMVSFSACEKPANPDDGLFEDEEETPEFKSPITIDGDFSDWDKLDPSKVAVTKLCEGAKYKGLKIAKVYADAAYINVYVEWDAATVTGANNVIHTYINTDNDNSTGGYGMWLDKDADAMTEFHVLLKGEMLSYDPSYYKWWLKPGEDPFAGFRDPSIKPGPDNFFGAIVPSGSGLGAGAGSKETGKYEFHLLREMMTETPFADSFTIGFDLQQNWGTFGRLPIGPSTEDNAEGFAKKLLVKIDK